MKILTLISFLLLFHFSHGQIIQVRALNSMEANEKILMKLIDTAFQKGWDCNYNDSVTCEDIFIKNLLFVLQLSNSFGYKFSALVNQHSDYNPWRINIIYSDDSLFRVFNWLSPTSGSWHCFPAVFQAKNKNNKVLYSYPVYPEGSQPSTNYEAIYRLRSTPRQLYLCIGRGQGSGRLPFEIVETYEVAKDSIVGSDILPGSTHFSSTILVDRQSTMYDSSEQDIPEIIYNNEKQLLKIPEIAGNYDLPNNVRWTGKLIQLKFNGREFLRLKN